MKNKLIAASIITSATIAHFGPALGIALIACGDEISRALGACLLFSSSLALGYFHGLNRTHESF